MPKLIFREGHIYHVYNRAHGFEKMFSAGGNYSYFLHRCVHYVDPVASCLSYCLMPNHFHLLIQVRERKNWSVISENTELESLSEGEIHDQVVKRLSSLFNSYTKGYNKQQGRKGSLFMHSFRRKPVTDEKYLRKLIHYIHRNPVEAGLVEYPENWPYSSYRSMIFRGLPSPLPLDVEFVMQQFSDLQDFVDFHGQEGAFELLDKL